MQLRLLLCLQLVPQQERPLERPLEQQELLLELRQLLELLPELRQLQEQPRQLLEPVLVQEQQPVLVQEQQPSELRFLELLACRKRRGRWRPLQR